MPRATAIHFLSLSLLLLGSVANADIFVPNGLKPGDTYQLIFATNAKVPAINPGIAYYNAIAQELAERNSEITGTDIGVQYSALAATVNDPNIFNNAPITAPVYNLVGDLIASGSADMFDGSLSNPIAYDQFQATDFDPRIWTGFDSMGAAPSPLGLSPAASGWSASALDIWALNITRSDLTRALRIYALSEPITVVAEPEPMSLAIWSLLGLVGVGYAWRRRCLVA